MKHHQQSTSEDIEIQFDEHSSVSDVDIRSTIVNMINSNPTVFELDSMNSYELQGFTKGVCAVLDLIDSFTQIDDCADAVSDEYNLSQLIEFENKHLRIDFE